MVQSLSADRGIRRIVTLAKNPQADARLGWDIIWPMGRRLKSKVVSAKFRKTGATH